MTTVNINIIDLENYKNELIKEYIRCRQEKNILDSKMNEINTKLLNVMEKINLKKQDLPNGERLNFRSSYRAKPITSKYLKEQIDDYFKDDRKEEGKLFYNRILDNREAVLEKRLVITKPKSSATTMTTSNT